MSIGNATAALNAGNITGQQTGQESSLSSWAGPYVTEMLGKGRALSNEGYQAYGGPLTAGANDLQNQAFQGVANLVVPTGDQSSYSPQSFTDPGTAQQFMNPYLQSALQPQLDDAQRQNQIQQQQQNSELSRAGAFGGSRQAVMNSQMDDSLMRNMANITGQGYRDAFGQAQGQFNTEQDRNMASANQNQSYGLEALAAQGNMGQVQRGIESEGIAADRAQFEEERMFPYKQTQYMQSLLQDMPIGAQSRSYAEPSQVSELLGTLGGVEGLMGLFQGNGGGTGGTAGGGTSGFDFQGVLDSLGTGGGGGDNTLPDWISDLFSGSGG